VRRRLAYGLKGAIRKQVGQQLPKQRCCRWRVRKARHRSIGSPARLLIQSDAV